MLGWIYLRDLPLRLRGAEWAYLRPRGGIALHHRQGPAHGRADAGGVLRRFGDGGPGQPRRRGDGGGLWRLDATVELSAMPAFAIASAVSAMVAQNVGAGLHERVSKITMRGLIVNGADGDAGRADDFDAPLLKCSLFRAALDPDCPAYAADRVDILVLLGIMMILTGTMRAYGAVIIPLVIMFVAMYPARVGFYFAAFPYLGAEALRYAYPFSAVVAVVMTSTIYLRGNWRKITPKKG
jgi:hypothetical protein